MRRTAESGDGVLVQVQLPRTSDDDTLHEAQEAMIADMGEGVECPCCGQFVKIYKRRLNSGMAATLVWLVKYYQSHGRDWVHVQKVAPRYVIRSNEIGKLVHWGFVEQDVSDTDPEQKTSGRWRPTPAGIDYALRKSTAARHVYLYNNEPAGFSNKTATIEEALGKKFNYQELMRDNS